MEDKEYLTYEEVMQYLGIKRSTLYSLITTMNIDTQRFKGNKKRYIARADVVRLKEIREKPWTAEPVM